MQKKGLSKTAKNFLLPAVIIMLFVWLSACNNKPSNALPEVQDSITVARRLAASDSAMLTLNNNALWLSQNLGVDGLHWAKLQLENYWTEDTLEWQPFVPGNDFYKDYQPVLHWSPDSSYVLDVGSYGLMVVKDIKGNTTLEAGDPDNEISVIVPAKNEKARLMFAGPASYVSGGNWLDSSQAIIVGTYDKQNSAEEDTLVWIIDVKERFFRLYNYKANRP